MINGKGERKSLGGRDVRHGMTHDMKRSFRRDMAYKFVFDFLPNERETTKRKRSSEDLTTFHSQVLTKGEFVVFSNHFSTKQEN